MRQTGKTLRMVEALPEAGAIVVVHTGAMADYIRQMIRAVRGAHVGLATKVLVIRSRHEAERYLTGTRREIHVDHAFWEHSRQDVVALVRELKAGVDATHEPAPNSELTLQIGRLDLGDNDIVVLRSPRPMTREQAESCKEQLRRLTASRGLRGVSLLLLEPGAELSIIRPAPEAQEPRRTPFGCLEAPERLPSDAVTSASISEAFGAPPAAGGPWADRAHVDTTVAAMRADMARACPTPPGG